MRLRVFSMPSAIDAVALPPGGSDERLVLVAEAHGLGPQGIASTVPSSTPLESALDTRAIAREHSIAPCDGVAVSA
jgi:hypothetical protein